MTLTGVTPKGQRSTEQEPELIRIANMLKSPRAAVLAAFVIVVASAHFLFRGYFPGPYGLGHDYSLFLPDLLANYYWARAEQPWSPPWFTPAFCGGQPAWADPQSLYYSLPQVLVAFFDPVASVYITLLVFIGLGFAGTYLFLRLGLSASMAASIVGAVIFALNGFFSHRMLIGHLSFHGIMLVPWFALALVAPTGRRRIWSADTLLYGAGAALVLAYWIASGMAALIIPALLAVVALVLVHSLAGGSLRNAAARATVAMVFGLALTASKVAAALAYSRHFPRTGYLLPGLSDVFATVKIAITTLFLAPANIVSLAAGRLTNVESYLGRHEFEFSVTPVPILLAVLGLGFWLNRRKAEGTRSAVPGWRTIGLAAALLVVLCIPIAVNTYGPAWNAFLKSVPVVGSSSNLFRWFFVYIPVIAAVSALAVDHFPRAAGIRLAAAIVAFILVVFDHALVDRNFYASQHYDPRTVSAAFLRARASDFAPAIWLIGANMDAQGRIIIDGNNDLLATGASQLGCNNPMFGYGLEFFPVGALRPGDPLQARGNSLNLKDPACYLFPSENRCAPGDHFSAERRDDAERFLAYRSYPFNRSTVQQSADMVNRLALIGVPIMLFYGWWTRWRTRRQQDLGQR